MEGSIAFVDTAALGFFDFLFGGGQKPQPPQQPVLGSRQGYDAAVAPSEGGDGGNGRPNRSLNRIYNDMTTKFVNFFRYEEGLDKSKLTSEKIEFVLKQINEANEDVQALQRYEQMTNSLMLMRLPYLQNSDGTMIEEIFYFQNSVLARIMMFCEYTDSEIRDVLFWERAPSNFSDFKINQADFFGKFPDIRTMVENKNFLFTDLEKTLADPENSSDTDIEYNSDGVDDDGEDDGVVGMNLGDDASSEDAGDDD